MKNKITKWIVALTLVIAVYACKKSFLDIRPTGVLDEVTLSSEKGVNRLLIAAYAMLDGHDNGFTTFTGGTTLGGEWGSGASNFVFGSMAGGEANRGSSPGDQGGNMSPVIRHDGTAGAGSVNDRWIALYEGVKRTNTVLQVLEKTTTIADSIRRNLAGQARFLRAWYHFQARIMWNKVPYLDEKMATDLEAGTIQGVANDVEIFPKIIEDVKYAYENLPVRQDAVGRANKWVAGALYGKVLMFAKDYPTARTVLTDVVNNGTNPLGVKFNLNPRYEDNFNVATENSPESVFAFQSSAQDNAGARNGNWGDNLNTPAGGGLGGAGFFTPTYYFTNKFKTDALGLPLANPDNNVVLDPAGMAGYTQYSGNVDTRLDWTVGRNGVPFHDWGTYETSWRRDVTAGPFAGKKIMIRKSQVDAVHDASVWFSAGGTALNINLLRFADVILLLAEAEIEAGGAAGLINAFSLINRVRTRAQNSSTVPIPSSLGTPVTRPYAVPFTSQAEARSAVRLERLLELGMEGQRFFDLVRWGTATTELNAFYNYESAIPYQANGDLNNPKPTYAGASRDYYDIPQRQIDLSRGLLKP